MPINFDLISDLYIETLDNFTWENKASSLFCLIAGNVARDRVVLVGALREIAKHYDKVFFLDGSLEHEINTVNFDKSYKSLTEDLADIKNVVLLHENIVLMNGATILATNAWTTFNFTNENATDDTIEFLDLRGEQTTESSDEIIKMALQDQMYLHSSIGICQTMIDCQNIVVVTNTVPKAEFIKHNDDYSGTILGDTAGSIGIDDCLEKDTEGKVSTWVFGTYPADIDYNIDNVRYVSNPAANKDLEIYFPKIIEF